MVVRALGPRVPLRASARETAEDAVVPASLIDVTHKVCLCATVRRGSLDRGS